MLRCWSLEIYIVSSQFYSTLWLKFIHSRSSLMVQHCHCSTPLRSQHCHCSGLGYCFGVGSSPGLDNFYMLRACPPPPIHSFQVQLFYSYYTPDPVLHAAQIRNRVGDGPCSQGFPSQRGRGKRQRRPWPACRLGVWLASCIPGVLLFEGWMVGDELTVQVVSRHEGRKRKRLPPCTLCQDYLSITYHRTTFPAKRGGGGSGPE